MADRRFADTVTSSASHAFAISPHASDPLEAVTKAICVGGTGNVTLHCVDSGADVTGQVGIVFVEL